MIVYDKTLAISFTTCFAAIDPIIRNCKMLVNQLVCVCHSSYETFELCNYSLARLSKSVDSKI
jgi:hypothetical protein